MNSDVKIGGNLNVQEDLVVCGERKFESNVNILQNLTVQENLAVGLSEDDKNSEKQRSFFANLFSHKCKKIGTAVVAAVLVVACGALRWGYKRYFFPQLPLSS